MSRLCPLMATSSLKGRDRPRGAAGLMLDVTCQNSLVCSSWAVPLFCELTGHGLGTTADPEEMEFRWPKSAVLCPPGMSSWLYPQRQGSSLWLLQIPTGQESWTRHTRLWLCLPCIQQGPLSSLWTAAWAFHPFSAAKATQCPQHSNQCPQDKNPELAGGPGHCYLTLKASPSLQACLGTTHQAWLLQKLLLLWKTQLTGAQAPPSAPGLLPLPGLTGPRVA